MAITIGTANPNNGEATYAMPANSIQFWFQVSTLATDAIFRGSSTGTPDLNLIVDVMYGPFNARELSGSNIFFQSAGDTTIDILVETGLNS